MDEVYLRRLLAGEEGYELEFKEAKNAYSQGDARDYCAALANENGGFLLLGVNDMGQIVGTQAFARGWNRLAHQITESLRHRVKVYQVKTAEGRVLVFETQRHPTGHPVQVVNGASKYRYPIRDGESLVEMSSDSLREIFAEAEDDWSARTAPGVIIEQLDPKLIERYRYEWAIQAHRPDRAHDSIEQVLSDARLVVEDGVTNAAILLFGTEALLAQYVPDAEIIYEWRNSSKDTGYGERKNWRQGFMGVFDDVWSTVAARNTVFRYQEGFIQRDIPAYDEESIREAIVNAFVHRDYKISGQSVRIRVSPESFYIENPGRLMPGVTLENILDKTAWRNRLLAESLEKIHVMERSSQGIDTIFRKSVESGKGLPVMHVTPDPTVELTIPARLVDEEFIKFLEAIVNERQLTLSAREIIELENIRKYSKVPTLQFKDKFIEAGIVERVGRGRGSKYILSHKYYAHTGDVGKHAQLSGLSRDMKRATITSYLKKHKQLRHQELQDAMPDMTSLEISSLLRGMRKDGLVEYDGSASPRWGYWRLKNHKES